MHNLKRFLKLIFTPVTIMIVPHSRVKPFGLRIPCVGIFVSFVLFLMGTAYVFTISVRTIEYYRMRDTLTRMSANLRDLNATMDSLKLAEAQFRKLFSLKSKKEVLENFKVEDTGSLDMEALRAQIDETMKSVADVRRYVAEQKDIYQATPAGFPAAGPISSGYGYRERPTPGARQMHTGVDISVPQGTRVRATADGIVTFSGWSNGSGNTVVIEHGYGFSTAYAHNTKTVVPVGRRVKRGDTIALSGSTGISTGPHIHYEIWKNRQHVKPNEYLSRG